MKYIKHVARELISYVMHAAREMNFESLNIYKYMEKWPYIQNGHTKMAHTILMVFVFVFFRKEIFLDGVFLGKGNIF